MAGRPKLAPGEKTVELRVRVPESTITRLDAAAESVGMVRSEVVRSALEDYLEVVEGDDR